MFIIILFSAIMRAIDACISDDMSQPIESSVARLSTRMVYGSRQYGVDRALFTRSASLSTGHVSGHFTCSTTATEPFLSPTTNNYSRV